MSRVTLSGLLVVATVALAGVGFAAFTANAYITGGVAGAPGGLSGGSLTLIVTALSEGAGTPAYIALTGVTGIGTSLVHMSIGLFSPGDTAYLDYTVKNTGTLGVPSPNIVVQTISTNACDSLFSVGATGAPTFLGAGASFSAIFTISEEASPPAVCAGASATVTLTVTGTT